MTQLQPGGDSLLQGKVLCSDVLCEELGRYHWQQSANVCRR